MIYDITNTLEANPDPAYTYTAHGLVEWSVVDPWSMQIATHDSARTCSVD